MPKPTKKPLPRVGRREHFWMYAGPNCWKSKPYRFQANTHGQPPATVRNLVKKGWMWAQKVQTIDWMPKKQQWSSPKPGPEHWCGLTALGLNIIRHHRDRLHEEFEERERARNAGGAK